MISTDLLTQTADVKRTSISNVNNPTDDYGEITSANGSTVYTGIAIRVTRNNWKKKTGEEGTLGKDGYTPGSTYKVFANLSDDSYGNIEIKPGDLLIINDGRSLFVDFVDRSPGGVINEHQQIDCSSTDNTG